MQKGDIAMKATGRVITTGVVALSFSPAFGQTEAVDWTGFYAGLGLSGGMSGEADPIPGPLFDLDDTGIGLEAFVGYHHQFASNLVLGAELGYNGASFDQTGAGTFTDYGDIFDLKLKLGYAFGQWMPYLVAGGSRADGVGFGGGYTSDGTHYGIGVNYAVNDRMFIGVELLERDMNGDASSAKKKKASNTDLKLRTLAVRVGWRF